MERVPNPKEVGKRIREIRTKLGLSMEEFASRIDENAKSGTVSNWETGKNLPNNERLKKIAEFGNISVSQLLTGLNEKIAQCVDEIMSVEIKEKQSQKYKLLYDPYFKEDIVEHLSKHYNFDGLTDNGIKSYTSKLLDEYLNKKLLESKYEPYSNRNAINFTHDILDSLTKGKIDGYFRKNDTSLYSNNLNKDDIKGSLSYELYEKLFAIIDDAKLKIRLLRKEYE